MFSKSIVLASLAVSAVYAIELYPGHNALKRDLAARQTADSSAYYSAELACATALQTAYASLPTAPPALLSWEATVSITDECHFTYPASISSIIKSYGSEVEDWYSSHSKEIASALSECPTYSSYTDLDGVSSYADVCSTAAVGGGGSDATTTADSGKTTAGGATGTAKGTAATAATTTSASAAANAGPKETAAVGIAAMAVVGVLGVVAAL